MATGCTTDTNTQHLHDETAVLPIKDHLCIHSSNLKHKSKHPTHPLHLLQQQLPPPRRQKPTIFFTSDHTLDVDIDHQTASKQSIKRDCKGIHDWLTEHYLSNRQVNNVCQEIPIPVDSTEATLPRKQRVLLSQIRAGKSTFLLSYLHLINPEQHPSEACPICNHPKHDSIHLFQCPQVPTDLTPFALWEDPIKVSELLDRWRPLLPHLD